jgi:heptaprenyl diphosphate synthase
VKRKNLEKLVFLSVSVALAMILSFVESLIPPLSAVPGVKLGLANVLTVFVLYKLGWWEACVVSSLRVLLSAILFGSFVSLTYSAFGAAFSLTVMIIAKKLCPFSALGVSVLGAVSHNAGQILAAFILMGNGAIAYYLVPLVISGTISGVAIGLLGGIVGQRIKLKGFKK